VRPDARTFIPPATLITALALSVVLVRPGTAGTEITVVDSSGRPIEAEKRIEGPTLTVTAPGFLPWSGPLASLKPGPASRIVLLRPATLRGRVTSGEAAIEKARVSLVPQAKQAPPGKDFASGPRGAFEADRLNPGLYTLKAEADGCMPRELVAALREGEVRWIEIDLRQPSRLSLRVTDADGKPLAGVDLRPLTQDRDGRQFSDDERQHLDGLKARTDDAGRLTFGPIYRGLPHRLVLRRDGFAPRSLRLAPAGPDVSSEIVLRRGGTIHLTVREPSRRAVPGATASLASDDADLDLLPAPRPGGADGTLNLGPLPAGIYSVRLQAAGYRPKTIRGLEVKDGGTADGGAVVLESGLEVRGTVRDEEGTPIRGAAVEAHFFEEGRELSSRGATEAEGRFRLRGLPPGETEIRAEARGYLEERLTNVETGVDDVSIVLARQASIEGQVVDAATGRPVPSFEARARIDREALRGRGGDRHERAQATARDPEGRFRIDGLRPGTYVVEVVARGYKTARRDRIEAGPSTAQVSFDLERGLSLEGTVVDADDNRPIVGATVEVFGLPAVATDPEGRFRLEGLEESINLQVDHPHYLNERLIEIDPETSGDLLVRLQRGGSLEGSVYDGDGVPLPGAVVRSENWPGQRETFADAAGRYRLDGLPLGELFFRKVNGPGTLEGYETALVRIEAGRSATHDFGVGTRLHGWVTFAGRPASGAALTFTSEQQPPAGAMVRPSRSVRAAESGLYEARGLRPGAYAVVVRWENRRAGSRVVVGEAAGGQRADIDIPDLHLAGRVVDAVTKAPLRGRVHAEPSNASPAGRVSGHFDEDGEVIEYSTYPRSMEETDGEGRFRLQVMEPGPHLLTAVVDGYRMEKPLELEVTASRDDLLLPVAPAIEVAVRATDAASGRNIEELGCVLVFRDGNSDARCGTGVITIGSLRPGTTFVGVTASGYAPAYREVTLEEPRHEVALTLTRGGNLRLLLPPDVGEDALRRENVPRLFDTRGVDLTRFFGYVGGMTATADGEVLVRHLPAGRLSVEFGRDGTPHPPRRMEVDITEGGEALADLR
jgi:protocatechuate 3,4-dioxygenase beta subunit